MSNTDLLPYSKDQKPTEAFLKEVFEIMMSYIYKTFDRDSKVLDFHHPHQFLQGIEGKSAKI